MAVPGLYHFDVFQIMVDAGLEDILDARDDIGRAATDIEKIHTFGRPNDI